MTKKAALAAVESAVSRRDEVRASRRARRESIIYRWGVRCALMSIDSAWSSHDGPWDLDEHLNAVLRASHKHHRMLVSLWMKHADGDDVSEFIAHLLRVIQLKEMPYEEYLQTDDWKVKAARAKEKFGLRCALDANHPAEQAHHRTYERRGREHEDDLIPLCADCHRKFHNR